MPKGLKRTLAIALICVAGRSGLFAQVTPALDIPQGNNIDVSIRQPKQPAEQQPTAAILGWTFDSEIETQSLQSAQSVLEAGRPELILFFTVKNGKPEGVEFRYRLDDYDPDWTLTRNHNAHYRRLAPGHYRFEVQARSPGQPWMTEVARLSVIQRPVVYQTWYADVLVLLLLVALTLQLLQQRDQLLKGQMGMVLEERNRIASDCHDTLMAGFAAVSWQLETTRKLLPVDADGSHPAAKACELARSMVMHCQAEARRIIWDLRSPEWITDLLSEGLTAAIESHRLREAVPTSLLVEGEEVPISPGAVHHLVCICQEAMTNAIHHANAARIDVSLQFAREMLTLSIADDGDGFQVSDSKVRTGHFGISVMEERARKLGGALHVNSTPGAGTKVVITVHFQGEYQPISHQTPVLPWIGV